MLQTTRGLSGIKGWAIAIDVNAIEKAPAFVVRFPPTHTNLAHMELQHTPPTLAFGADGTAVTDDGLVLKNVHKAERINTNYEARVEAPFESWQICRLVRRDFNFVITKCFHRSVGRRDVGNHLRDLGYELRLQAEYLRDEVAAFEVNPEPNVRTVPIRLFTHLGGSLYRSMLTADKAYARLNYAFSNGKVSEIDFQSYSRNFELAWADIKAYLNDGQSDKSAQELGAAQGIA